MKKLRRQLLLMVIIVITLIAFYLLINVNFNHLGFALSLRLPRLVAMSLAAICIGISAMVFQSVVNNRIVTPSLLGMSSLYTLMHTAVYFVLGSTSVIARNQNLAFGIDIILMAVVGTFVYGFLFKKTKYNILYILLIGTVMGNLFGSIQETLTRVMDPNEYESLLTTLVASFSNENASILILSAILIALVLLFLRKEFGLLDVITLGRDQAINLGVDYDQVTRKLLLGVVLLVSISTAMVGPISFLGLIVANISRERFKTYRHKYLITGSMLLSLMVVLGAQLLVEHLFSFSIPISVFITLGGGIYFLYLLLDQRKGFSS